MIFFWSVGLCWVPRYMYEVFIYLWVSDYEVQFEHTKNGLVHFTIFYFKHVLCNIIIDSSTTTLQSPVIVSHFIGYVCWQRLCINFFVSRVNFLSTLLSHFNVSCCFWSSLFNVDFNYSYILTFYCSGYLTCVEKDLVNYTYSDGCWLFKF